MVHILQTKGDIPMPNKLKFSLKKKIRQKLFYLSWYPLLKPSHVLSVKLLRFIDAPVVAQNLLAIYHFHQFPTSPLEFGMQRVRGAHGFEDNRWVKYNDSNTAVRKVSISDKLLYTYLRDTLTVRSIVVQ